MKAVPVIEIVEVGPKPLFVRLGQTPRRHYGEAYHGQPYSAYHQASDST
ncbi:MAG: hypothetical protein OXN20_11970 [Gemmatimonadota bacterium]|nr:hypothetical protein [Gemmatimonadota bacterium]